MSKMKKETIKWSATLGVVLVLWLTGWHKPLIAGVQRAVLITGIIQPDMSEQPVKKVNEAPHLAMIDEDGNRVNLADLVGKPVFLNVWATWCPPCKAEMPGIQKLYEDVKQDGIQFVMISTDRDFEVAKAYKAKNGYTFPIYRVTRAFPQDLNGRGIPRTYVLDGTGAIRMSHNGMAQYDTQKFRDFLKEISTEGKEKEVQL